MPQKRNFQTRRPHPEFKPLPFLGNAHVQTLLGYLWKGRVPFFALEPRRIPLPDGDQLVVHDNVPDGWHEGGRAAVLVHGLGGSHRSGYMQRMAALLWPHGFRVVLVDMRGCGHGEMLSRRLYNGACSDDIRAVVEAVGCWGAGSIALLGFSLGGNIVLKLAGEAAVRPLPGLDAVAALAPPIDLERCAALIGLPRNRFYERHFTRAMVCQVRQHERHFPDLPRVRFPRDVTLRQFDDLYTGPRGGFRDALDYYRQASSYPLLGQLKVRALVVAAQDDPFVAVEPFERLRVPEQVTVQIVPRGGHLGFLGADGAGGIRWAERRMANWLAARI